jgi:hypothetical protein
MCARACVSFVPFRNRILVEKERAMQNSVYLTSIPKILCVVLVQTRETTPHALNTEPSTCICLPFLPSYTPSFSLSLSLSLTHTHFALAYSLLFYIVSISSLIFDFSEYKCRFCCNVACWFCWGTTHFCDACHRRATEMSRKPQHELPKCTCNVKHPPNGVEFCLGCSLCRLQTDF